MLSGSIRHGQSGIDYGCQLCKNRMWFAVAVDEGRKMNIHIRRYAFKMQWTRTHSLLLELDSIDMKLTQISVIRRKYFYMGKTNGLH